KAPLVKILILSQVGNGIWLPIVLVFILLLVNRKSLMGEHVNGSVFNVVAWGISIAMIVLTLVLAYASIFKPNAAGLG
ncbi:MAG: divalent metal cation transporter, partial [Candidatus Acidiferrales bacterium]